MIMSHDYVTKLNDYVTKIDAFERNNMQCHSPGGEQGARVRNIIELLTHF